MTTDPYSWSVAEVADFFRKDAISIIADIPHRSFPDMNAVAQVFEANSIAGFDLIDDAVDTTFLRDECNIGTFGMRRPIVNINKRLQERHKTFLAQPPVPETPRSLAEEPLPVIAADPLASSSTIVPDPMPLASTPEQVLVGESTRAAEHEVTDQRGRKRRRLELSAPAVLEESRALPGGYLPEKAINVDEVFFGKTPLGGELGELSLPSEIKEGSWDGSDYWYFQNQEKTDGEVGFIHKQMRHFILNDFDAEGPMKRRGRDERLIRRRGRDAIAIMPYRASIPQYKACKIQSALVVQMPLLPRPTDAAEEEEQEAIAVRENVAYLDADVDYTGLEQGDATGDWDYLAEHWGKQSTDVLPAYDPESASISSSLAELIAEEKEERTQAQKDHLDEHEIEDIVNEEIDATVLQWRDHKLPRYEVDKAWTVWSKMKKSKQRRASLVAKANSQIAMLANRLDKQCKEFIRGEWKSKKELVQVCRSMEATVEDRELCKWKIDVWHRKQEPFHEVRHGQHSSSKTKSTHQHATSGLGVHPNDRISVEPAAQIDSGGNDDQEFHTPPGSPGSVNDLDGDAGDEMDIDSSADPPLADFVEESTSQPVGSAFNAPQPASPTRSPHIDQLIPNNASDSDPDDELPEPSTFVKSLKHEPKSSAKEQVVIDLCSDSTASSKKRKKRKKTKVSQKISEAEFATDPNDATAAQVRAWDMGELIAGMDRQRVLLKLLMEAGSQTRKEFSQCLTRLRRPTFTEQLEDALLKLKADPSFLGSDVQWNTMIACAKIYLAYYFLNPSLQHDVHAKDLDWTRVVHDKATRVPFVHLLDATLQKNTTKLFVSPKPKNNAARALEVVDLDSSSEDASLKKTPSKQRKQKLRERAIVKESQVLQINAERRQLKFAELSNSQDLATMVPGTPSKSAVMINITKEEHEKPIYVDKQIAEKMKPHQLRGVRFMWRELTALNEGGQAQGCVLAHTMGLGKTMQTITVLVALSEAAQSNNSSVRAQLPKSLRRPSKERRQLRIFVLCPASLLTNWRVEIEHWARDKLSPLFVVERVFTKAHQKQLVNDWYKYGGVLLMGYENFQKKMPLDEKQLKNRKRVTEKDDDLIQKLLDGAEVVVADEAHKIKNEDAGITKSAQLFKTKTRIALTGTPMANDVQEIYSLISWIAPKYLGDSAWFNAKYGKPIKDGNGKDSTQYEVRKGLKQLELLHRKIAPKVDRANIEVLKGSLSSKVEFHITLPLSASQHTAYTKYVRALLGGDGLDKASQVAIFGWLALLTILVNHPLAFRQKLLTPPKSKARGKSRDSTPADTDGSLTPLQKGGEDDEDEADVGVRALSFSKDVTDDIVSGIMDDTDPSLSVKMTILMDVVRLSKACDDKLIIFTHRIPTLDYMAELFHKTKISFGRIDGRVEAHKRLPILEDFKNGKYDLMIISTQAGGTGLNIQTANRVVILDAHFNPAYEEQAIGRSYRLGQTKPVFVYRFVSGGTFEHNVWNKQVFKTSMSLRVVDKKKVKRNADHNSREYLYEPRDVKQGDVLQYLGRDPAVLDHILKDSAGSGSLIRDIETAETLQEEVVEQLTEEEQREVEQAWLEERAGTTGGVNIMPPPSTAPVQGRIKPADLGFVPRQNRNAPTRGLIRLPMPPRQNPTSTMPHGLPTAPPPPSTMPPRSG